MNIAFFQLWLREVGNTFELLYLTAVRMIGGGSDVDTGLLRSYIIISIKDCLLQLLHRCSYEKWVLCGNKTKYICL